MTEHDDRLARLGDTIEGATARDTRASVVRARRAVTGLAVVTVVVACGLGALAVAVSSAEPRDVVDVRGEAGRGPDPGPPSSPPPGGGPTPEVVARGMVDGAVMFAATDPSCTTRDGVVFTCELAWLPTAETTDDYTGVVQTFVDGGRRVAGGCQGQDRSGRTWTCRAGEAAVRAGYLAPDLLGQYQPVPGRG